MHDQLSAFEVLSDEELIRLEDGLRASMKGRQRTRRRRHRLIAGAAVLLVAGLTTAGTILAWPINRDGQTYGPADGRVVDPSDPIAVVEPDLTWAMGDDGVEGYVLSTDLNPVFASPDEATQWQAEHPPTEDRVIPLYDRDGTVIGTFTIQGLSSFVQTEEGSD